MSDASYEEDLPTRSAVAGVSEQKFSEYVRGVLESRVNQRTGDSQTVAAIKEAVMHLARNVDYQHKQRVDALKAFSSATENLRIRVAVMRELGVSKWGDIELAPERRGK